MKSKINLRSAVNEAVIIVVAASAIALFFNQFRSDRLDLMRDWSDEAFSSGLIEVSIEEAIREFQEGKTTFLDVRSQTKYRQGHIPKSLSLPYDSFYEKLPVIKEKIFPARKIIIYGGEEFLFSNDSAILLQESGFRDVRVFSDGWDQWKEAGLPVEKGTIFHRNASE